MSNELCVKYLPYCRETTERKATLLKCYAELKEDEVADGWFCGESIEEIRETLIDVADEYWKFAQYAEVCVIRPPESPISYLISGGNVARGQLPIGFLRCYVHVGLLDGTLGFAFKVGPC